MTMTDREHATTLAALRFWQRHHADRADSSRLPEMDIASNGGTLVPMHSDEIEAYCEHLNCSPSVAPSSDWRSIAQSLAGALGFCTQQIEQMRGMFDDKDDQIQDALDDAEKAQTEYDAARDGSPSPVAPALPVAVVLEGGMVSAVITDDAAMIGRKILVIDYDTDDAADDDTVTISQSSGRDARAFVNSTIVEATGIDLEAVKAQEQ